MTFLKISAANPPSGANAHYAAMLQDPALVVGADMRSEAQLALYGQVGYANHWAYDAGIDGARCRHLEGEEISLPSTEQLWVDFPLVAPSNGDTSICVQYEMMWGSAWLDYSVLGNQGWSGHFKAFRLDNEQASGDEKNLELQTHHNDDIGTEFVMWPAIRGYGGASDETDYNDDNPIRVRPGQVLGLQDEQPGGYTAATRDDSPYSIANRDVQGKPWIQVANQWARFTWYWEFLGVNNQPVTMEASDEVTGPRTIFESLDNPGNGFNYYNTLNDDSGGDLLRVEFNTSSPTVIPPGAGNYDLWVRNLLVFRNKRIPQGGRPIAS